MGSWWRRVNAGSEWLAVRLALVFGLVWTVWIFFLVPLIAPVFPVAVQAKVLYYGSGWIQLFALPLLTWIGNKTQKLADEAQQAQGELLAKNTELTEQVREMVSQNRVLAQTIKNLTDALAGREEE